MTFESTLDASTLSLRPVGSGADSKAVTTRLTTTSSLITWSSHRSNSRTAKLDAITPTRVQVCLSVANLVRRPSQLAGPSSIVEGFILPITPHPLGKLPAQLHGNRGPRSGARGNCASTNSLNSIHAKGTAESRTQGKSNFRQISQSHNDGSIVRPPYIRPPYKGIP